MTFRWLHPVSLALYPVQFDADPVSRAAEVAELVLRQSSRDELANLVKEIELELDRPTQPVRAILDSAHTEEQCRDFLRVFASTVRARLG